MSKLENIDQVRARNALSEPAQQARKKGDEGDALSGYPSLIINNGLIATLAFSLDRKGQHQRIANAVAHHLEDRKIAQAKDAKALRDELCQGDSAKLRRATGESLAFLAYLKRFQR